MLLLNHISSHIIHIFPSLSLSFLTIFLINSLRIVRLLHFLQLFSYFLFFISLLATIYLNITLPLSFLFSFIFEFSYSYFLTINLQFSLILCLVFPHKKALSLSNFFFSFFDGFFSYISILG